jgi:hypothetical protein
MKRILVAMMISLLVGCQTTTVKRPTRQEYIDAVKDVSLPMKQRQKLWQEMRKHYPTLVVEEPK